jgi:hypothetical protein
VDPIPVPAPPRSSYNHNRRVSDLLFSQLKHFQHVAEKHGALGIPADLGRDIYTEAGAARYIAAVTRALRGTMPLQPAGLAAVSAPRRTTKPRKTVAGSAVAATAARIPAPPKKSVSKKAAKKATKKAATKRRTARKTQGKK